MGPEEGERDGGGIGREGKDVYAESSSARRAPFIGAWMYDDDMLPAYMRDNGSHTLTCMLCHAIGYGNIDAPEAPSRRRSSGRGHSRDVSAGARPGSRLGEPRNGNRGVSERVENLTVSCRLRLAVDAAACEAHPPRHSDAWRRAAGAGRF